MCAGYHGSHRRRSQLSQGLSFHRALSRPVSSSSPLLKSSALSHHFPLAPRHPRHPPRASHPTGPRKKLTMLRRASIFAASAVHRRGPSGARRPRPPGLELARLSQLQPSPPTKYAALKLQSRVLGIERCFSSTPVTARGKAGASVDPRHIRSPGIIVDPYTEGGGDGEGSGAASSVSRSTRRDATPLPCCSTLLHKPCHATPRHATSLHTKHLTHISLHSRRQRRVGSFLA